MVRWLREAVGLPDSASGTLTNGGSAANLVALTVARNAKAGVDVRAVGVTALPKPLRFYASDQVHSCHQKALEVLGLGRQALRLVATDAAQLDGLHAIARRAHALGIGFRLGVTKQPQSRWYAGREMPALLKEDELIRKYLNTRLGHAAILREGLGPQARKVPKLKLPNWLVRIAARFDPVIGQVIGELGKRRESPPNHAREVLGWVPRPVEESILDTARDMIRLGIVRV